MEDLSVPRQKRNQPSKIIDQITPGQAVSVLQNLWHTYPDFRARIEAEIKNVLTTVDYNEVASDVESKLDFLDEEELYKSRKQGTFVPKGLGNSAEIE